MRAIATIALAVPAMLTASCVQSPSPVRAEPTGGVAAMPQVRVIPPAGKTSAQELAGVFAARCLAHLPDYEEALASLRDSGLQIESSQEELIDGFSGIARDGKRGISVEVSKIEFTDIGPNESSIYFPQCSVAAEVSDPETDWSQLTSRLMVDNKPIKWAAGDRLSGQYKRAGKEIRVEVGKPHLEDGFNNPEGPCGGVVNCFSWTAATMSLSYQE